MEAHHSSKRGIVMKKLVLAAAIAVALSSLAVAYDGVSPYQWDPTTPSYNPAAQIFKGTIDLNGIALGKFVGVSPTQPDTWCWGDSGAAVGWDDSWTEGCGPGGAGYGDELDGKWAHIGYGGYQSPEGWWDLKVPTKRVAVFLSQDHSPYLGEATEVRVQGSNEPFGTPSAEGSIVEIYLDGWRPWNAAEDRNGNGWTSDDISVVFELPAAYRYVRLTPWSSGYYDSYGEPEVDAVGVALMQVQIDIKPGSYPNSINLGSGGVVPVAILSGAGFDATQVNPATVELAAAPVQLRGKGTPMASFQDVNGDGLLDLVVQVTTESLVLSETDTQAVLTGSTFDGVRLTGSDTVRIVP